MAVTDALTGLHNRRYLDSHLQTLFERAMGADMHMIPPSGAVLARDQVITHVRANRGAFDDDFAIEIADIRPAWQAGDAIVVTYIEKQRRAGKATARRASALFTGNPSAPNGVEWRHLHETWMQAANERQANRNDQPRTGELQ